VQGDENPLRFPPVEGRKGGEAKYINNLKAFQTNKWLIDKQQQPLIASISLDFEEIGVYRCVIVEGWRVYYLA